MKKIALSLAVLLGSATYVWSQHGTAGAAADLSLMPPSDSDPTSTADPATVMTPPQAPAPTPPKIPAPMGALVASPAGSPVVPVTIPSRAQSPTLPAMPTPGVAPVPARPGILTAVPLPRLRPASDPLQGDARVVPAAMIVSAAGAYVDGSYAGPITDAYYGLIEVQVTVQGGQLSSIRMLKYPSDRRTSIAINRHALPILAEEAISAQTGDVDIVSGATLTSEAFIRSMDGALRKARS